MAMTRERLAPLFFGALLRGALARLANQAPGALRKKPAFLKARPSRAKRIDYVVS
jgi:hypothetical protein